MNCWSNPSEALARFRTRNLERQQCWPLNHHTIQIAGFYCCYYIIYIIFKRAHHNLSWLISSPVVPHFFTCLLCRSTQNNLMLQKRHAKYGKLRLSVFPLIEGLVHVCGVSPTVRTAVCWQKWPAAKAIAIIIKIRLTVGNGWGRQVFTVGCYFCNGTHKNNNLQM